MERTIIAQASAVGRGAISIVRMSGETAVELLHTYFSSSITAKPNLMRLGVLNMNGVSDKVMAVYYTAPNSYTGEDMVEFFCHGSQAIVREIISFFSSHGASLASGGEFTKRAYLNGKISLDEAEAVADLINAESKSQINVAFRGVMGTNSRKINSILAKLSKVLAYIEVAIDYPEEELEEMSYDESITQLTNAKSELTRLASTFNSGSIIRSGVRVAIVGLPNVGKSSLYNSLLGYDRAIVGDTAGTTRDALYESFTHNGLLFNLVDTAGLRDAVDSAEIEGVKRANAERENAHVVIWLGDDEHGFCDLDTNAVKSVKVLNKIDKSSKQEADLRISTVTGQGIDELRDTLASVCECEGADTEIITNARHYGCLMTAIESIDVALNSPFQSSDCLAVPIKSALNSLGEIVGVCGTEKVIDDIFATFCVGK